LSVKSVKCFIVENNKLEMFRILSLSLEALRKTTNTSPDSRCLAWESSSLENTSQKSDRWIEIARSHGRQN
jgi:hypothetical protein